MNLHDWLAAELAKWGPAVVDHLWQSTLFALLIFGASLIVRRGSANVRHSLWLLALVKFAVPTGLTVFLIQQAGLDPSRVFGADTGSRLSLLHGLTEPVTSIVYEITVVATAKVGHSEIYCALGLISLTGTVVFLSIWRKQRRKFLRALLQGRRVDRGRELQALERAREILNWKTDVSLIITPDKTEPAVCRVWKPVLLMPQAIADHLNDGELEAIMLHELVHVRRRDNLVGNIQMAVCALLWFHPLVWLISSRLFDERELACDEEVLKLSAAPDTYASSILKVVRFSLGWRVAGVTGAGSGSNLRRRIENIMTTDNTRHSSAVWRRLIAGTLVGSAIAVALAAGFYNRVRASYALTGPSNVQAVKIGMVADSIDPIDQTEPVDVRQERTNAVQVPPQPQQPPQPPQPPQSSQPAEPAQPVAPAPPAQSPQEPSNAVEAPAPPAVPSAASPATAPLPPTKEKSKSKGKDKRKDEKQKVDKGGVIELPQPVYPVEGRERKIQGEVRVAIVVGEDGSVVSAKPTSGPEALHAAARDAAFKARFHPTMVNGKPAKVSGTLSYSFVIDNK